MRGFFRDGVNGFFCDGVSGFFGDGVNGFFRDGVSGIFGGVEWSGGESDRVEWREMW